MTTRSITRAAVAAALAVAVVVTAVVILGGGDDYTIRARFLNADGLVTGGRVQVGGRQVGKVAGIDLSDDGQAVVTLSLDDRSVIPLRSGTRATIRAVGQAGLANRFVDLTPGPASHPALGDGATLATTQTSGIVNIDALLDSFGPANRAHFQQLMAESNGIYAGSGARSFNAMLRRVAPASRHFAGAARELALDRVAIGELIQTAGLAATAVAGRRDDLASAVQHTADSLGAIAAERRAVSDTLVRAPAALQQATVTLAHTRTAVTRLRPSLRQLPVVARPLRGLLDQTDPLLRDAGPVLGQLRSELPQLGSALTRLGPLEAPLVRALRSTGTAMRELRPALHAARLYGPDLILGVFSGLVGVTTGEYDARGHYAKVNFVQSPQSASSGPLSELLQQHPLVPGVLDTRTQLTRRCPGGLVAPAPDGSSPWELGEKYCSAADDIPASVNVP